MSGITFLNSGRPEATCSIIGSKNHVTLNGIAGSTAQAIAITGAVSHPQIICVRNKTRFAILHFPEILY